MGVFVVYFLPVIRNSGYTAVAMINDSDAVSMSTRSSQSTRREDGVALSTTD